MNPLINTTKIYCETLPCIQTTKNVYIGDILATSIVIFFVAFALLASVLSTFIFLNGSYDVVQPMADLFSSLYTKAAIAGIV